MKIRYFSWLKDITKNDYEVCDVKNIKDINKLKDYLIKKYPKLKEHFKNNELIRIAINLSYTYENDKIKSNDEIAIFPPVSGG